MAEKDTYFVALKLFLEDSGGRLFIFKDRFGDWDIPGGRLLPEEFNLPFEKIIQRKMDEEMGSEAKYEILSKNPEIIMRHERNELLPDGTRKKAHILALGYRAKYLGGKIDLGKNHVESKWINPAEFKPEEYFAGGWLTGVKEYVNLEKSSSE